MQKKGRGDCRTKLFVDVLQKYIVLILIMSSKYLEGAYTLVVSECLPKLSLQT